MRSMMNGLMKVTEHNNDCTQKEVADFMVPSSVGKPFKDAPGTFDPKMHGRVRDTMMGGMMVMDRTEMKKAGAPHNKGITWEKYCEHRPATTPGYVEKSPNVGDLAPDATIKSINGGPDSTLMAEAKKAANAAGTKLVILSFDGITCPFYRAYAAEDLYKVSNGVPHLHVYLREAEPCDVFDAGGMHMTTPLAMKRPVPWHKTEADRAKIAKETKGFFETFMGDGKCNMWMDTMDDNLEALYEARPWRQYVVDVTTGKVVAKIGLAPFQHGRQVRCHQEGVRQGWQIRSVRRRANADANDTDDEKTT
ncbi:hypothetical protein NFJ02_27g62630 [Pycnococcus provasolii]